MADQTPKDGPELAAYRIKMSRKKARKEREKALAMNKRDPDATLIGQLKAAQSNARNVQLREKVFNCNIY